jgi:transposase
MDADQRHALEELARCSNNPYRVVQHAKVLLMAADGVANSEIAERLDVSRNTVLAWRARFDTQGVKDFGKVRPGRGRKFSIPDEVIADIVWRTLHTVPEGQTHWSTRTMAKASGVSRDTVHKIWSARGIKPHLTKTFKVSNDPRFEEKLTDVVGLYLHPPDKAVVLCADEKSQIQALDRTQASLPMKRGRAGTMTHDYNATGPPRCSPPWTSSPAWSWARACHATATTSSWPS